MKRFFILIFLFCWCFNFLISCSCECDDPPKLSNAEKGWFTDNQTGDSIFFRNNHKDTFKHFDPQKVIHEVTVINDTTSSGFTLFCDNDCPTEYEIHGKYEEYIHGFRLPKRFNLTIEKTRSDFTLDFFFSGEQRDEFSNHFKEFDKKLSQYTLNGETYQNVYYKKIEPDEIGNNSNRFIKEFYFSKKHGLLKYTTSDSLVTERIKK